MRTLALAGIVAIANLPAYAQGYNPYNPYQYQPPQGYTITTPGQMPTYVNPNGAGGYTMTTPGQMPTYVNPNGAGGYTVTTPGRMPSYINPR
jgi:hypothetical protein